MSIDADTWSSAGAAIMLVALLVFLVLCWRVKGEDRHTPALHAFVCAVAAMAYLAAATDLADVHRGVYLAPVPHYVYWAVSQPLILVSVVTLALRGVTNWEEIRPRSTLLGALVGASLLWNVAALTQALTAHSQDRWIWFGWSAAALLIQVLLLAGPLQHEVRETNPLALNAYRLLAAALAVLWTGYLVTFLFGDSGLHWWGHSVDVVIYTFLDVANDVPYGILTLILLHRLTRLAQPSDGEGTAEALARMREQRRHGSTDGDPERPLPPRHSSRAHRARDHTPIE